MTVIAMLPARIGSTRLKKKNLALVDGEPMIGRVIRATIEAACFDRIVVNSDSPVFSEIADRYGVEFYSRPEVLGGSSVKSDDVVYDFIQSHPSDVVAWVNPIAPLQQASEISACMSFMKANNNDSLFTVRDEQVHCVLDGEPVNFSFDGKFAQTQDLVPVRRFVYSMMAWRAASFSAAFERDGHAFFVGSVGYFPVSHESGIIVKTEADLMMVDMIAQSDRMGKTRLTYDRIAGEE